MITPIELTFLPIDVQIIMDVHEKDNTLKRLHENNQRKMEKANEESQLEQKTFHISIGRLGVDAFKRRQVSI